MLIEDTPISPAAGGLYRRQNALTGLIAGIVLGFVGWIVSHQVLQGSNWGSDMVVTVTMVGWVVGFNIGVGTFNAPFRWLLGHDQSYEDELYAAGVTQGKARYWKFCTDHKVVGTQYLVLVIRVVRHRGHPGHDDAHPAHHPPLDLPLRRTPTTPSSPSTGW